MTPQGPADDGGDALLLRLLPVIERIVRFVCRRHHVSGADAEDFASHVKLKLLAADGAILRQFSGRSSIDTYLSVVIQRLFVDFRRAAWGKWRPSSEATRLGEIAVLAEQLVARDGHSADEAYELMTTNHRVAIGRAEFERLLARLPWRPGRRFENDESLVDIPASTATPDRLLLDREAAARRRELGNSLRQAIAHLPTQDQLVLTMRFEDGRTVAEIALALRVDQKGLYRHINKLLKTLRQQLEAAGLDGSMVQEPGDGDESGPLGFGEKGVAHPSMNQGARPWP